MKALLLVSALFALLASSDAAIHVTVDAKTGDTISGERTFKVTVDSTNPVNYVEFYVNGELRDKQTSTPYKFVLDSVEEPEGAEDIVFKAYTSEGEVGKAEVKVQVNNGLTKGIDTHLQAGVDDLHNSSWADAITEGRVALKIDGKSLAARLILAHAYFGMSDTGKAQKYAQDVIDSDPNNVEALNLSSAIELKIAFRTFVSSSGDKKEALTTISDALKSAVTSRRKVLDHQVDNFPTSTGGSLAYVDAALHAFRYSLAISTLRPAFDADHTSTPIANRLAFALVRIGRYKDAWQVLVDLQKFGQPDAYTDSLLAIIDSELGDMPGMDKALSDALLSDPDAPVVADAQAYIALKYIRPDIGGTVTLGLFFDDLTGGPYKAAATQSKTSLQKLLGTLERAQGNDTATFYYTATLDNKLSDFGPGHKAFESSVLAEPANSDAYIEEGNRALTNTQMASLQSDERDHELATADTMYQTALIARPDSAQALTGLALVATIRGNLNDAIKWGEAAVAANPQYAAGQLAVGTAYTLAAADYRKLADAARQKSKTEGGDTELQARKYEAQSQAFARQARTAGNTAGKLDPRLVGQDLVKPYMAWRYFRSGGRVPAIPQPPTVPAGK